MTAFVLGNGISRESVDLNKLKKHGKVYGCNAIYRTFTPDVLVSTDQPISTKIQQSGYSQNHRLYTRRPFPNLGAEVVPKPYFGYSSGPIAVAIAATVDNHSEIYLVGFDLGPTTDGKFNNVYAGTEFYKQIGAVPTYTGNWVKQLSRIISDCPRQIFIRVAGPTTSDQPVLNSFVNYKTMSLQEFLIQINTTKEH